MLTKILTWQSDILFNFHYLFNAFLMWSVCQQCSLMQACVRVTSLSLPYFHFLFSFQNCRKLFIESNLCHITLLFFLLRDHCLRKIYHYFCRMSSPVPSSLLTECSHIMKHSRGGKKWHIIKHFAVSVVERSRSNIKVLLVMTTIIRINVPVYIL